MATGTIVKSWFLKRGNSWELIIIVKMFRVIEVPAMLGVIRFELTLNVQWLSCHQRLPDYAELRKYCRC